VVVALGGRAKVAKNAFLPLTVAVTPFCMFLAVIMLLYHFFIKKNNRKYQMMFLNQAKSEETLKSITDFVSVYQTKFDQF